MADIAHHPLTNYQASAVVPRLRATLALWRRRARERAELARLGERELRDIGMSPGTLYTELGKPFWRA